MAINPSSNTKALLRYWKILAGTELKAGSMYFRFTSMYSFPIHYFTFSINGDDLNVRKPCSLPAMRSEAEFVYTSSLAKYKHNKTLLYVVFIQLGRNRWQLTLPYFSTQVLPAPEGKQLGPDSQQPIRTGPTANTFCCNNCWYLLSKSTHLPSSLFLTFDTIYNAREGFVGAQEEHITLHSFLAVYEEREELLAHYDQHFQSTTNCSNIARAERIQRIIKKSTGYCIKPRETQKNHQLATSTRRYAPCGGSSQARTHNLGSVWSIFLSSSDQDSNRMQTFSCQALDHEQVPCNLPKCLKRHAEGLLQAPRSCGSKAGDSPQPSPAPCLRLLPQRKTFRRRETREKSRSVKKPRGTRSPGTKRLEQYQAPCQETRLISEPLERPSYPGLGATTGGFCLALAGVQPVLVPPCDFGRARTSAGLCNIRGAARLAELLPALTSVTLLSSPLRTLGITLNITSNRLNTLSRAAPMCTSSGSSCALSNRNGLQEDSYCCLHDMSQSMSYICFGQPSISFKLYRFPAALKVGGQRKTCLISCCFFKVDGCLGQEEDSPILLSKLAPAVSSIEASSLLVGRCPQAAQVLLVVAGFVSFKGENLDALKQLFLEAAGAERFCITRMRPTQGCDQGAACTDEFDASQLGTYSFAVPALGADFGLGMHGISPLCVHGKYVCPHSVWLAFVAARDQRKEIAPKFQ
ncbi:hypothetical protein Anapl_13533 [Anas platyrhynchos]|uniref:Uncharacterized protein n=1 Tax=Anas platyrhynchos TaxID=8839 RepID=R0L1A7_ANAPL|nr:hypothetical protein Anapl_13533 [Anas platyrhynchos]